MSKNRLTTEDYFDFRLIGLVSNVKEYKLVWHLNQTLRLELEKKADLTLEFKGNDRISVSNFLYRTEHKAFHLLQNRLVSRAGSGSQYLLDELRQFDFLFKIKDETDMIDHSELVTSIKSIEVIDYAANLEPALIKARDNLIF